MQIGDMGLSRVKMDSDTYVSGSMRGTIPWMAPELFFVNQTGTLADGQTEGLVTEKVDVFSFGVVRTVLRPLPVRCIFVRANPRGCLGVVRL